MTWQLIVGPQAEAEIADARSWYEEQRAGLGRDFLRSVETAFEAIKRNPLQYQIVWREFRRARLPPFRYNLIYRVSGDLVRVVACVDGARNPEVWQDRI